MGGTAEIPGEGESWPAPQRPSPDPSLKWDVWLGPGARLATLAAALTGLARAAAAETGGPALARVHDLEQLAGSTGGARGRLVLDVDALPAEDLGYVRRFLERRPGWSLCLCGDTPGRGSARELGARHRARWLAWPPDLVELEELLLPLAEPEAQRSRGASEPRGASERRVVLEPRGAPVPSPIPAPDPRTVAEPRAAPVPSPIPAQEPRAVAAERARTAPPLALRAQPSAREEHELREIQAVLARPPGRAREALEPARADDPFAVPERVAPRASSAAPAEARAEAPAGPTALPSGSFRAQVADLADIAQRVDLALRAVRPPEQRAAREDGFEPLAGEVARLVQFTRTLGYLVAPPPRGDQRLDLGVLLDELVLATLSGGDDAPRHELERDEALVVRSDKGLLIQALDAFLVLARRCAGPDGLVRVEARADAAQSSVHVTLDFPAGPLAGLAAERIAEPYALRELVPGFGPNALLAATGILTGQGGGARLVRAGERLVAALHLPQP